MALSSFRVLLLGAVERVLRRWLNAVSGRLNAAPRPAPAASLPLPEAPAEANGMPAPPEHWLELVRQHAPQLLDDAAAPDAAAVYDYHSDDLAAEAPQVVTRAPQPRRASVVTPQAHAAVPVPTVKTAPKRPLRLGNVRAQAVDVGSVNEYNAQTRAEAGEVSVSPSSPLAAPELPRREVSLPDEPEITPRFSQPTLQHHVREVRAGLPPDVDVSSVSVRTGNAVRPNERRTSVPRAPEQMVLRPTVVAPALNIEQVTPDRWASLPELPSEPPPNATSERARRERLKREQGGRTWNG